MEATFTVSSITLVTLFNSNALLVGQFCLYKYVMPFII